MRLIFGEHMKQITIVAEDKVGLIADISYILGKAKINIETIMVEVYGGKAVINLTVKDEIKAAKLYDHTVINQNLDQAVLDVEEIILNTSQPRRNS